LQILPKDAFYYFTKALIPRALNEKLLADRAVEFGLVGNSYPTVNEAYTAAKKNAENDDMIFIGGSTFVVAEVV
jgi:dihydrofolate synthase/folylpolyglutamate synthase